MFVYSYECIVDQTDEEDFNENDSLEKKSLTRASSKRIDLAPSRETMPRNFKAI